MLPDIRRVAAGAADGMQFIRRHRRPAALYSAAAFGLGAAIYCAVGYAHYARIAGAERAAAERAERANAGLQDALARLRNQLADTNAALATAQSRVDALNEETKRQLAQSEQASSTKADRIAQLNHALEQVQRDLHLAEAQRATLSARLSKGATDLADEQARQSQAQTNVDQLQKKLQQLTVERDKAVGERDHLRSRVGELEQKLSAREGRDAPRPVADARPQPAAPTAPSSAPTTAPANAPTGSVAAATPAPATTPATAPVTAVAAAAPPAVAPAPAPATTAAAVPAVAVAPAEPAHAEAPRAAPAVAAADGGRIAQVERVLAAAGVDVRHLFAEFGVNRGEGGPFIPASAQHAVSTLGPEKLAALVKALPVSAPLESYEIGSPFGVRGDPINGHSSYHTGLDLRAPYMSPVYATATGTVTYAGYRDDYGKIVEIDHGNGLATRYAHLHRYTVSVGQRVAAHSQIGFLGSSGRATGPHVHYEVLVNGEPQDPAKFLGLFHLVSAAR